jgi:hypothetical protein
MRFANGLTARRAGFGGAGVLADQWRGSQRDTAVGAPFSGIRNLCQARVVAR